MPNRLRCSPLVGQEDVLIEGWVWRAALCSLSAGKHAGDRCAAPSGVRGWNLPLQTDQVRSHLLTMLADLHNTRNVVEFRFNV